MYRNWRKGKDFALMHVLSKLENCPKLEKTQLTLNDNMDVNVELGPVPPSPASVGRPVCNKKAKAERNGTASSTAMGSSIDMLIAKVVSSSKDRDDERDDKNNRR
jgi:hypothetical protein